MSAWTLIVNSCELRINRCIYKLQAESSASYDGTAKEYWNGFTNAAKDIVTASDLVSMISGRQKVFVFRNISGHYIGLKLL